MAVYNTHGRGRGYYPVNPWNNNYSQRGLSNNNFNGNFKNNLNNNFNNRGNRNTGRNTSQNMQWPNQNMAQANPTQNAQPYYDPSVIFEPLDPQMLEQLKGIKPRQTTTETSVPAPSAPSPLPSNPAATMEMLRAVMQNEKNGAEFYEKLSKLSADERQSGLAIKLNEQCKKNQARIRELQHAEFSVADMETISPSGFREGLLIAINEENAGISEILDMCERENEEKTGRFLNLILMRKLCAINEMRGLLYGY